MSALPNRTTIQNNLTENEAYELIKFNWLDLQNVVNKNVKDKKDKIKDIEALRRVNIIGQVVGIKAPAWKENELYKLIQNEWTKFTNLGVVKDFTYLLSYKAIVYILNVYDFPLKVDYSNNLVTINKVTTTKFPYTEEQSLVILRHNAEQLEESSGVSIYELKHTTNLAKALKTNQTSLYRLLKENLAELELLGCSKKTSYNLTYRGVVFLLNKQGYPLDLNYEVKPKVVYLYNKSTVVDPISQPVVSEPTVQAVVEESKPDIEGIRAFLTSELLKRKAKSEEAKFVANESARSLKFIQDANFHLEMLEECLQEVA